MRASDKRHQISKNARNSFDSFWNRFPTFWSVNRQAQFKNKKLNPHGCVHACAIPWPRNNTYLNSSASSPHNDFSLWMARIGMRITSPFRTLLTLYTYAVLSGLEYKAVRRVGITRLSSCLLIPCRSIKGSLNGITVSFLGARTVFETGEWRRRTSRVT